MKVSNKELLESVNALSGLLVQKLPVAVSFKLSKNINKINEVLKIYDVEKQKIIEEYSVKDDEKKAVVDEDGNIQIKEEFREIAQKEMAELLELKNDIKIEKISISKLEDSSAIISPSELMTLDYMMKE